MKIGNILSLLALITAAANAAPSPSAADNEISARGVPISSGRYVITSLVSDPGKLVGRSFSEDLSLLPKRIMLLADGERAVQWLVERQGNGLYKLKAFGAPVVGKDGYLFACLLECRDPGWEIKPVYGRRDDAFIVKTPNSPTGWFVAGDEIGTQISVRPLIVGPSEPPFYPPLELFKFTRVDTDFAAGEAGDKLVLEL